MHNFSSKENFLISNTLSSIPILLQSQAVIIEMRNDTTLVGCINVADGYMNIHLDGAVFIDRMGKQYPFNHIMVRERMIRQIIIPSHINMNKEVRDWCEAGCLKVKFDRFSKRKRTFKQKRAQEQDKKTLQELAEQKIKDTI